MGWVVNATPMSLYPRERSGIHRIGGCLVPRFLLSVHRGYLYILYDTNKHRTSNVLVTLRGVRSTFVAVGSNENYTSRVCVFLALGFQHAMRMRHVIICGLHRSTISLPRFLINGTIFGKKKF